MVSILASRPSCTIVPEIFSEEKNVHIAEVNQIRCFEESGQWLQNVDWTHLVLASGKRVSTKNGVKLLYATYFLPCFAQFCRTLKSLEIPADKKSNSGLLRSLIFIPFCVKRKSCSASIERQNFLTSVKKHESLKRSCCKDSMIQEQWVLLNKTCPIDIYKNNKEETVPT